MWPIVIKGATSFLGKYRTAKAQAAWDRYHNAMTGLQAAQAQNTVTDNVAINREKHAENKVLINTSRMMAAAKVKAGAAAIGAEGGAVEATIFDIGRNAGKKLAGEEARMRVSLLATDQQRRGVALQKQMATRIVTQTPSLLSALASTGMDILDDQSSMAGSSGTNLDGAKQMDKQFDLSKGWDKLKSQLMI